MSDYDNEREEVNKGGGQIKEIDYTKLDAMCAIQCTGEECSAILNIDYDTLNAGLKRDGHGGFSDYFKLKGANGKMSLRRKQFEQASSGNSTMLIWLGKQWLGQAEKSENITKDITHEVTDEELNAKIMELMESLK